MLLFISKPFDFQRAQPQPRKDQFMYPYSHALIGGLVGVTLFPNQTGPQLACAIAATLPDFVATPFHISRIFFKKDAAPLTREISHSLIQALSVLALWWEFGHPSQLVTAGIVGWLSHILIDALTHSNPEFSEHDASLLWPFDVKLGQAIGVWDYRHPFTKDISWLVFIPKLPEVLIDLSCVALLVYLTCF